MNDKRASKIRAIAVAVMAVGVLAAAASQDRGVFVPQGPKPEKICPIDFILEPVTSLQQRFATDTEKANANLSVILVELRQGVPIPELAKKCADKFAGTYLARPVLWNGSGMPVPPEKFPGKDHERWEEILGYLRSMIIGKAQATYLQPQSVRAYLEYLPYPGERYKQYNPVSPNSETLKDEIDFLVNIRTVLAYAPYDDPLIIGNEAPIPHKKVCDPIY